MILSPQQFREFCRVLDYPKFNFSEIQKNKFKNLILEIATLIQPQKEVNIIKEDPDDNLILESALAGDVNYIITGDQHLLKLKQFERIKITTPRDFINFN